MTMKSAGHAQDKAQDTAQAKGEDKIEAQEEDKEKDKGIDSRTRPAGKKGRTSPSKDKQNSTAEPAEPPDSTRPDPTRYGDWEKKGRCIDF